MMRRYFLTSIFAVVLAALFSPSRAEAQSGTSVGFGVYYGQRPGGYYGPAVGISPLYYPGFYGNGMSMYGPPVPTYSPVPGTFGGSDYRVNQNAPFIGTNVGVFGSRSPNYYHSPASGEPPLIDSKELGTDPTSIVVEVRLPLPNATVFFNNQLTVTTGSVRLFSSPALKTDQMYKYEVRAEWIIDGRKTSLTRTLTGNAGERLIADFAQ